MDQSPRSTVGNVNNGASTTIIVKEFKGIWLRIKMNCTVNNYLLIKYGDG